MLIAELTVVPVTMKLLTESRAVPSCVMTVAFLVPSLSGPARLRLAAQASGGPAGRAGAQTAVGLQSQSETPRSESSWAGCCLPADHDWRQPVHAFTT